MRTPAKPLCWLLRRSKIQDKIIRMFDSLSETGLDGDSVAAAVRSLSVADLEPFLRALPAVGELDDFCLVEAMKGWERVSRGAAARCGLRWLSWRGGARMRDGVGRATPSRSTQHSATRWWPPKTT